MHLNSRRAALFVFSLFGYAVLAVARTFTVGDTHHNVRSGCRTEVLVYDRIVRYFERSFFGITSLIVVPDPYAFYLLLPLGSDVKITLFVSLVPTFYIIFVSGYVRKRVSVLARFKNGFAILAGNVNVIALFDFRFLYRFRRILRVGLGFHNFFIVWQYLFFLVGNIAVFFNCDVLVDLVFRSFSRRKQSGKSFFKTFPEIGVRIIFRRNGFVRKFCSSLGLLRGFNVVSVVTFSLAYDIAYRMAPKTVEQVAVKIVAAVFGGVNVHPRRFLDFAFARKFGVLGGGKPERRNVLIVEVL